MMIIAGLGNPGDEYDHTRHNTGFDVIDELVKEYGIVMDFAKHKSICGKGMIEGEKVMLVKPQTYMNLSGEAVGQAARFYKIPADHVLVVSDDITLPIGAMRIRTKGSAGGHNGLKNIISVLGTEEFPRIRLGVGSPPHPDYDTVDWVLSVFRDQDAVDMAEAASRAADAVECFITQGPEKAMNLYRQKKIPRD